MTTNPVRSYPPCGRGIRHWFAGEEECSHCGMPKPSEEITVDEAKPGDYALLKIGSGRDWVKVIEFFPGAGDQLRYCKWGYNETAMVRNVVAWRTTSKGEVGAQGEKSP